jgi:aspartate/methionine/tyrosine aminotransferase
VFSRRTGWGTKANRLAAALAGARRAGARLIDLTVTNPTRAGLDYPVDEIRDAVAEHAATPYDPDPRGDPRARRAISSWYSSRGIAVDPERIVLTASTSEAYGWLFKLLCDPGDRVLVPRPSYPLFDWLARLEAVRLAAYPLRFDLRWEIDRQAMQDLLGAAGDRPPGAIVAVHPNNPTGSVLSRAERSFLTELAAERGPAIVSDEVFSTYAVAPSDGGAPQLTASFAGQDDAPAFVLDGLSKAAGLPGIKAGWIVVRGPSAFRDEALARLEVIADTYLSVSHPAQQAIPRLLEIGARIAGRIRDRTRANAAALQRVFATPSACRALPVEGGWSAVLRLPRTRSDEEWCLELLQRDGVAVQPGWYFDFEEQAYLIVSLLADEAGFADGIARIRDRAR